MLLRTASLTANDRSSGSTTRVLSLINNGPSHHLLKPYLGGHHRHGKTKLYLGVHDHRELTRKPLFARSSAPGDSGTVSLFLSQPYF